MCLACHRTLHASRAFALFLLTCLPLFKCLHFLTCLTCLHFLYMSYVLLYFYVSYVPLLFTCLTWLHFLCALCALIFWRVLRAFISLCVFPFLSVSNFWRAFMCLHFFYKMWSNPEPIATSWNKQERSRVSQK